MHLQDKCPTCKRKLDFKSAQQFNFAGILTYFCNDTCYRRFGRK